MFCSIQMKKSPDAAPVAVGSSERPRHTKWNQALINVINCTCIGKPISCQCGPHGKGLLLLRKQRRTLEIWLLLLKS